MVASDVIQVLFDVPPEIARGLRDKSMLLRGGVVQWATGEKRGEIVAWLRESHGLRDKLQLGEPLAPGLLQEMSRLGVGLNVVLGVQVLTLAVTAIGFAMVMRRLAALDEKVAEVHRVIKQVERDVTWLDRRMDVAIMAKVTSALETAQWGERSNRTEVLLGVIPTLLEAEHHYAGLQKAMLEQGRAMSQPDIFAAYAAAQTLVGVSRACLHALVDGIQEGASVAAQLVADLQRSRVEFQTTARTLPLGAMLALGHGGGQSLTRGRERLEELEGRVGGYAAEMAFCASHHLSLAEWRSLGSDVSEPRLLCLVPRS